jgi:hypothetical protein
MAHGKQRQRFIKAAIHLHGSVLPVVHHNQECHTAAGSLEIGEVQSDFFEYTAM